MSISNQREFFRALGKHPERFYVIHYSCQNLYGDNEGLSPRVTSIAVLHYGTDQAVSFSTHAIAEELGVAKNEVTRNFDQIELKLLKSFFDFLRDRRDKYWVHWNMRNITYGSEHIEHRYRTLSQSDPPTVPVEYRLNLNDMLSERFGSDYAPDPKMLGLMELNGGRHRHFLTGKEEVDAFKNGDFIRMHLSTLSKVEFFRRIIEKVLEGKLSVASKGFLVRIDRLMESRTSRAVALASSAIGLLGFAASVAAWFLA